MGEFQRLGLRLSIAVVAAVFAGCGSDSGPGDATPPLRVVTSTATAINTATPTSTSQPATATVPPTPVPTFTASVTPSSTLTAPPSPTPTTARTPVACAALAGMEIAGARVGATEMVDATDDDAAYCKLSAIIDPALRFELRLPIAWNRKVLFLGGAGYDGVIPAPPDNLRPGPGVVTVGYATIATDSGHVGGPFDGSFALDAGALDDFAYLARHRVLTAAREIIVTHYAEPIRRTYFEGGSSGGREALIEAQRWPDSFDGVIARAPALDFTALMLNANRIVQRVYDSPEAWLSLAAVQTLSNAVLAACDELDGLADAIVSNVAACHFDPSVLRCADDTSSDCLTDAQIETVNTVFSELQLDVPLANGSTGYPAYPISGAEDGPGGWPLWMTGFMFEPPNSLLFLLQDDFFKYFVAKDAQFDSLQLAPTAYTAELGTLSNLLDATDPQLSAFTAHGGKLILWHGLADYAISAYGTLRYYDRVVAAAGGQAQAGAFVRFYTSPAVDHTGSGNGAPLFDLLGALDAWVENGTAPGDLVAYRLEEGAQIPFRPLCRYPTYPRYDGIGDPHSAASFACTAP